MADGYIWLKVVHIFIAIIALGTSAGLGIVLEFYGDHPIHGVFILNAIRRLLYFVVVPGYALMLVTGLWLTNLSWSFSANWIEAALTLWGIGAVLLALSLVVMHKQIEMFKIAGPASGTYRRVSILGRLFGGGTGVVVVVILYIMVAKPSA